MYTLTNSWSRQTVTAPGQTMDFTATTAFEVVFEVGAPSSAGGIGIVISAGSQTRVTHQEVVIPSGGVSIETGRIGSMKGSFFSVSSYKRFACAMAASSSPSSAGGSTCSVRPDPRMFSREWTQASRETSDFESGTTKGTSGSSSTCRGSSASATLRNLPAGARIVFAEMSAIIERRRCISFPGKYGCVMTGALRSPVRIFFTLRDATICSGLHRGSCTQSSPFAYNVVVTQ